jgi:carboxyl-terminal processing protease
MKRAIWSLVLGLVIQASTAQLPLGDRLVKLCQVWGYLKYFHEGPSNCLVNWDSVLVANIPAAKSATSNSSFNNVLQELFNAAGTMSVPTTPAPFISSSYNTNLSLSWFGDPVFTSSIQAQLDTVRSRFRPHKICNVTDNSTYTVSGKGYIYFNDESVLNSPSPGYPDASNRLLVAFRYWNYIEYFFNSISMASEPWQNRLKRIALQVDSASSALSYHLSMVELVAGIYDTHGSTASSTIVRAHFGEYYPAFRCMHLQGKVVVSAAGAFLQPGIQPGDVVVSVNGIPVDTLMNRRKRYIPYSNENSLYRDLLIGGKNIFVGSINSSMVVEVQKPVGGTATVNVSRNLTGGEFGTLSAYTGPKFKVITETNCKMGYVHMGILQPADINAMYDSLKTCDAIIFDIRNYPNGTAWAITAKLAATNFTYALLKFPSTTYPGILKSVFTSVIYADQVSPYGGKIYLLVNERTQSQAEYSAMMLQACNSNVKVIGSQTAGADGNVTSIVLPGGLFSYFSTLGVFYPNYQITQRVGVAVDYTVRPTIEGIRNNRDELMEFVLDTLENCKALGIARSHLMPLTVYPNPFSSCFQLSAETTITGSDIKIYDSVGQLVYAKKAHSEPEVCPGELARGVYIVELRKLGQVSRIKLLAE